jgi:hypothetical protein
MKLSDLILMRERIRSCVAPQPQSPASLSYLLSAERLNFVSPLQVETIS